MKQPITIDAAELGFTIIELLIATTVVSVILLLSTLMITNIGNLYYKGVSESQVQDDVRSITDEISQQLELTDTPPTIHDSPNGQVHVYCLGNTDYYFTLYKQIGTNVGQSQHVLWRDTGAAGTCPAFNTNADNNFLNTSQPTNNGTELISPRSRLTEFAISPTSPYVLTVNIAFGDDDQLCDSNVSGDCNSPNSSMYIDPPHSPGDTILCKGSGAVSGQQFCGTANLTTTVVQRVL